MGPGPMQKLKREPASQARGATRNSLEQPALPSERHVPRSNRLKTSPPTQDMSTAAMGARLVKAGVPFDEDFVSGLLSQLIEAGELGGKHDDLETNFLISVIEGIRPRDMVEAMLSTQMAMVHVATVKQVRRLNRSIYPELQDGAANTLAKLVRTFATQIEGLTRHRSGGSASVSVGHLSINQGGQTIVGNVTPSQCEAGSDEATPSPPLLVDAKAVPMPSIEENEERVPVPESRTFEKK